MAVGVTHVWAKAVLLRDTVIARYAAEPLDLPARRLVVEGSSSTLAWDCQQLSVSVNRIFRGLPAAGFEGIPQRCAGVRTAEFHVTIIRCTSTPTQSGEPPNVANIESFAQPILTDAWFLPEALSAAALDGTLGTPCDDLVIDPLVIVGPQGGFGGVDVTVLWQLGG